ncbi:MAG: hypothetical protein ACI4XF_05930 [Oscillospiraceae bacterium]
MTEAMFLNDVSSFLTTSFSLYGKEYYVISNLSSDTNTIVFTDENGNDIPFKIGIGTPSLHADSIFNSVEDLLDKFEINKLPLRKHIQNIQNWNAIAS